MNDATRKLHLFLLGLLVSGILDRCAAAPEPRSLFSPSSDLPRVQSIDTRVMPVERDGVTVLRVKTGHAEPWPGITIPVAEGGLDLSPFFYVALRARNTGRDAISLHLRVDNPGADGSKHCLTGSARIEAGTSGVIRVDLKRTEEDRLGGKLFGMRGYPVKAFGSDAFDPARVNQFVVFLDRPAQSHEFELMELSAGGEYVSPTAWTRDADPFLPMIDTLGQYRHESWPGKAPSVAALQERREAESIALSTTVSKSTELAAWNQYGGWVKGPRLDATGFFRVTKHSGKWWLVDPEGCLFWSHGIDCVRMLDFTPIDERESWYLDPLWEQSDFAEFVRPAVTALKGHYAGRPARCFSFAGANLRRKYGSAWQSIYPEVIHQRLRAWGMNTIANWSDAGVARLRRTPYTDNIGSRGVRQIEGSEGYWGKFPDVFDPAFKESLRGQMTAKRGGSANDPWCLGYFSDNEMSWGDDVSLALAALASPLDQPAKVAFVADLKSKYNDIDDLNVVWGTSHASWFDFAAHTDLPPRDKASPDLKAFYTHTAETYFRTVCAAIKETAPNQLYLGCRFAWANPRAAAAAAKYCDIVSYNLYQRSIATFTAEGAGDVPLLIGEFHFGALDRGMFHTGLVPVSNQESRAAAYSDYVRGALRHPQFVGTHWFQYQDQPTTGRVLDEENYQIGFVDIADTPHTEMVESSRAVGLEMYRLRLQEDDRFRVPPGT